MNNPWLKIPLADYENHMALPDIGQAAMLSAELERSVVEYSPGSVAVIGCAGGNGFDQLARLGVKRIVGIDINPTYVEETRLRYARRIPGLELYVADIQQAINGCRRVDLVFAALVLEYVDVRAALASFRSLCAKNGALVVILQAASSSLETVSRSPFESLQLLAPVMRLHDPTDFSDQARTCGFTFKFSRRITLPSSKSFDVVTFDTDREA